MTSEELESLLQLSPVTWVLLWLILREVRAAADRRRDEEWDGLERRRQEREGAERQP